MEILKYVPGFRSGQTWKKVVASIFYVFTIIVGLAGGFGSFFLVLGMFLLACSIVDLILHCIRKKKDMPIKQSIITANQMMKMYSDDLVTTLAKKGIKDISEAAVFWKDSYNNRNLKYAYEYRNGGFYVTDVMGE